jgi:C1A family cysteine protease
MASPVGTLPLEFDLRNFQGKNYITPVRNQLDCNSCTAYAVVAAMEGAISIKNDVNNPTIHLSEDDLFVCGGPGDCDTDAWYPDEALRYCMNSGITTAADYGNNPRCDVVHPNISKIAAIAQLGGPDDIKACLTGTGILRQPSPVVTLLLYHQSLHDWNPTSVNQFYKFVGADPDPRIGGHAVCIIGYKEHPGYWICKNSFGDQWGGVGKGFFNIAYGDCLIDSYRMYGVAAS